MEPLNATATSWAKSLTKHTFKLKFYNFADDAAGACICILT